ncbi:MAG: hypothetical protein K2K13_02690 [Clostridiales bacterium]|nr:hypothetical protein [Clostridiales bacterium]
MQFVGSQKAKFIRYNLWALVGWLFFIISVIGGGDITFDEFLPTYSDHPRLSIMFFIIYGLVEIVSVGFIAYAFTFVVSPRALGLLYALGIYVAYLALGSLVEFIMWIVRKPNSDDDMLCVSEDEQDEN